MWGLVLYSEEYSLINNIIINRKEMNLSIHKFQVQVIFDTGSTFFKTSFTRTFQWFTKYEAIFVVLLHN